VIFRLPSFKVVAGAPIHACKEYALERYVTSLRELREFSKSQFEVELVLVDNTPSEDFYNRRLTSLSDFHIERCVVSHPRFPIHARIAASQNRIRQRVLTGGFDYWLSVEADVLPPPDALIRLSQYLSENQLHAAQGYYYDEFDEAAFRARPEDPFWLMGLSLVQREVLELIEFRFDESLYEGFSDAFFGHDMRRAGFRYGFCGDVGAEHLAQDPKDPKGRGWNLIKADLNLERRSATLVDRKRRTG